MANSIKYSTTGDTLSLKKGNFYIGVGDVGKGPSEVTGYYQGISPPTSGYTIYVNTSGSFTAMFCANNDNELINFTNGFSGENFTNATQCLNWYTTQSNYVCTNIDYESIVTDGLVLNLDAGFTPSYSRSGVTWYDTSLIGSNSTLVNGPTFDSGNRGSIVFDGSNDSATFFASGLTTIASVEMWCKIGVGYSNKMFMGWNQYDVWCNGGSLGFNTASSDVYGISQSTVSSLNIVNQWAHYVFEFRSDVSYTNNKIYINGSLQTLSQQFSSENASRRNLNNGVGRIASWSTGGYNMPMNNSVFRVYNRSLTQEEVTQNYNATKGRFGL